MNIIHRVILGTNSFRNASNIRRSAWIGKHCIVPRSCIIGERVKLKHLVILGENCFINSDTDIGGIVKIGKGCRIEHKVKISSCCTYGNGHKEGTVLFPPNGFVAGEEDIPIFIGDYVAIEDHCIIAKGISIGSYSVIMPGSVVFDNVEPYAIMQGNPAKRIGFRKISKKN